MLWHPARKRPQRSQVIGLFHGLSRLVLLISIGWALLVLARVLAEEAAMGANEIHSATGAVPLQNPFEAQRQSLELQRAQLLHDVRTGRIDLREPSVREKLQKLDEALLRLQPLIERNPANVPTEVQAPNARQKASTVQTSEHLHRGHELGEPLPIECLTPDRTSWEPMPCRDRQEPVVVRFGLDTAFHCSWLLDTDAAYALVRDAVAMQRSIHCRVPLDNERTAGHLRFFAPVTITLWGIAEGSHLHVNTHVNFVFHAHRGYILGAAAYSVRDHFQVVQPGGVLNLHGKVHWFDGHAFVPYVHEPFRMPPAVAQRLAGVALALWSVTLGLSVGVFTLLYQRVLKVRLIRRFDPSFKIE
ncbi:hypothetical protein CCYA_CCYA06G1907 [Cyanidiococcus yangmingshanensis]|nr:hypothetical protein CCYA_CCYA06G1907 [Cyanidiococcus yangmingshanensis]